MPLPLARLPTKTLDSECFFGSCPTPAAVRPLSLLPSTTLPTKTLFCTGPTAFEYTPMPLAFRRHVFALVAADEVGLAEGAAVARVPLRAADVCFFYTHWLHRAPAPPASVDEEARVCLFGVFGKAGASEGQPIFRHHVLGE